jgi:hypothetical protein
VISTIDRNREGDGRRRKRTDQHHQQEPPRMAGEFNGEIEQNAGDRADTKNTNYI